MKSQSTTEFAITLFLGLIFLMILILYFSGKISDVSSESVDIELTDISQSVQIELQTAGSVSDGYYRRFYVPLDVSGNPYQIMRNSKEMVFIQDDAEKVIFIPNMTGNVAQGWNIIKKQDGIVIVEQ